MSGLPGHNIGGTIHIIVNNQIGFTTAPRFARSSPYPSDVAKTAESPIFHVNGDDPEAVVHCAKIATEYRQKFKRDVFIDLLGYRKYGHNEGDEPRFTQPKLYKAISKHSNPMEIYSKKLIEDKIISPDYVSDIEKKYKESLEKKLENSKKDNNIEITPFMDYEWKGFKRVKKDKMLSTFKTNVSVDDLNKQRQVKKILDDRLKMAAGAAEINWGFAEVMAYASLLEEGYPIRLTGQDVGRGTFSHRHAVLHDQKGSGAYVPLRNLSDEQPDFTIFDSLLSEEAVLAFEYGYASTAPEGLVIWEAQFGDFANGAQVVIDQFITSGEHKWGRMCGLTMLLPHGYEGMGPEHSSARLERFLQLCAGENIQVMNCTTPANYFHALRRQMHRDFRKPLIVMTPKSLLRHKKCVSNISDFTKEKRF